MVTPSTDPALSPEARTKLDDTTKALVTRLFDRARRRAIDHELDTISARHVEEAIDELLAGWERPQPWRGWLEIVGGVLLGGATNLINEFTKSNRADWNLPAIIAYILSGFAGIALIAWAKYPR